MVHERRPVPDECYGKLISHVFGFDFPLATVQDDEKSLTETMQGYWSRFAHTGDPNGAGAPTWPKYTTSADQDLSLDIPASATEQGYKKTKCDFWDGLNAQYLPVRLFMWAAQ